MTRWRRSMMTGLAGMALLCAWWAIETQHTVHESGRGWTPAAVWVVAIAFAGVLLAATGFVFLRHRGI